MLKNKLLKSVTGAFVATGLAFAFAVGASGALCGDVTGDDSTITAGDARFVLRASVGLETLNDTQKALADVNEDGKITAADARDILRMSVGLEEIKHYYETKIITEPTCTEKGLCEKICTECDDKYEEEIPALGHNWKAPEVLVAVTCDSDGLEKYTCARCSFSEERTVAGGHVWNMEKATCTEDQYCTRGNHVGEKKTGHTTSWGVCSSCKTFVTDKYPEAAATIKSGFEKGKADSEKAYSYIESTVGAFSWLQTNVPYAKPLYESAKAAYTSAFNACGDAPEFAEIKKALEKNIANIDGTLKQIEVIKQHGYINNDDEYYTLVNPIDDLNFINSDSIHDMNVKLEKFICWK